MCCSHGAHASFVQPPFAALGRYFLSFLCLVQGRIRRGFQDQVVSKIRLPFAHEQRFKLQPDTMVFLDLPSFVRVSTFLPGLRWNCFLASCRTRNLRLILRDTLRIFPAYLIVWLSSLKGRF